MRPLWFLLGALAVVALSLSQFKHRTYPKRFRDFQKRYLCVFYTVMFADWLQGVTMYDLYKGYFNDTQTINRLFLTGFATSAVVSLLCGRYVDKWGRKKSCLLYCFLEIIINILEHVPDKTTLYVGRVLGGISTALLFVSFESWMVTEHRRRGFHEKLLQDTFSLAHAGNGIVAVVAGLVAQLLKNKYGDIGPFRATIAVTAVVFVYIMSEWKENHGEYSPCVYKLNRPLSWLCITYVLFESAMYTFVFNWVPALQTEHTGVVFACFMMCVTIGGMMFHRCVVSRRVPTRKFGMYTMLIAGGAIGFVAWRHDVFVWTLVAFLVFECCVGANMANQAALRSELIPQEHHAAVMHIFRVPLNILTCVGIWSSGDIQWTMMACSTALSIAALVHVCLPDANSFKIV